MMMCGNTCGSQNQTRVFGAARPEKFSPSSCLRMWGVAASILIASVALSIREYWLNNKGSALGRPKKQEPVKLLEELAKTAIKRKAGRK